MYEDLCLDCPCWGHVDSCMLRHVKGDCDRLKIPGVRHAIMEAVLFGKNPDEEDLREFTSLLERSAVLGNLIGNSLRHNVTHGHRFLRYRGYVKVLLPKEEPREYFFGTYIHQGLWVPYVGCTDNVLHYEIKSFRSEARYAGHRAGSGLSSCFVDVEVLKPAGTPNHSQGIATLTVQWLNHVNPYGVIDYNRDGRFFWQGPIPLSGSEGAENGFSLSGGLVDEVVGIIPIAVLF